MIWSGHVHEIHPGTSPGRVARTTMRALAIGAMSVALASTGVLAQSASPAAPEPVTSPVPFPATVAAPGSDPLGVSYAEWATRWWDWLLSFPADQDPAMATTCPPSPSGDVVFLPQTWFGVVQQLTCEVPAGTPILVTAGGSICVVGDGETLEDLPGCVAAADATLSSPSIAVDGRLVSDIDTYHAGQAFDMTLVKDNILGLPEGSVPASGTGWVVMLSDLAPGTHTILARDETTDAALGAQAAEMVATITVTDD